MSTQKDRIEDAIRITSQACDLSRNPVIMFSGGKDSLVMTHLITHVMGIKMDAIFHREPFFSEKYANGERVLRDWGIPFHDYPPTAVSLWEGKGIVAYTNHYQIGISPDGPTTLDLPKNIIEPEAGIPWVCGVDSLLNRPTGFFNYPWDMAFIGHKSSDEDQIAGKTPLKVNIVQNRQGPSAAFPLRNWTDADVWEYIEERNLPADWSRYDVLSRSERADKRLNGDYFHACIACIDKRNGPVVNCPKVNAQISNMSAQVPYKQLKLDYFGE